MKLRVGARPCVISFVLRQNNIGLLSFLKGNRPKMAYWCELELPDSWFWMTSDFWSFSDQELICTDVISRLHSCNSSPDNTPYILYLSTPHVCVCVCAPAGVCACSCAYARALARVCVCVCVSRNFVSVDHKWSSQLQNESFNVILIISVMFLYKLWKNW